MTRAVRVPGPVQPGACVADYQLELRSVTKSYTRRGSEQAVLHAVDLCLPAGTFVALTGPSGSGKTTLLEVAVGLQRPTSGSVHFAGMNLNELSETRVAALRLDKIGLLFKDHPLIDTLGAAENVALPLQLAGVPARSSLQRGQHLLSRLAMGHLERELPGELSQGERQRLQLARALANAPQLLVADEPTAGLDSVAADEVMRLLVNQVDQHGLTVLMATHDARAAAYAERSYRLVNGRLERA